VAYFDTLRYLVACVDIYSKNPTDCRCLENLDLTEEEAEAAVTYLINYFKLSFSEQRSLVSWEWKRYANILSAEIGEQEDRSSYSTKQVYLLPGCSASHRLCRNAIAKLIGKLKHAWSSIGQEGKDIHGLSTKKPNNSLPAELEVRELNVGGCYHWGGGLMC
jgi:hypothetical protein